VTASERIVIRNNRKVNVSDAETEQGAAPAGTSPEPEATSTSTAPAEAAAGSESTADPEPEASTEPDAELAAVRGQLEERTRDLQRITAEYANYRKRVDRDRTQASEQATGNVLAALIPVLDDLDRARDHGDLVGPFATVAEQLVTALSKFGLTPFGTKGDKFDPTRHEAVAHSLSAEVTEPTCVDVMRRGYLLGERLLRPAMVAVADPE
jgi:molecular chaperone GrpE